VDALVTCFTCFHFVKKQGEITMFTPRRLQAPGRPALAVYEGARQGPTVLFLHGLARRASDWNPLISSVFSSIHPIAIDWRGHGASDRAGSYLVEDYTRDLQALLPLLAHHPVILVGHSLGALVAAELASREPDKIAGVVLEDPPTPGFLHQLDSTGYFELFKAYTRWAGSASPVAQVASGLSKLEMRDPSGKVRPLGQMRDAASLRFMAFCIKQMDPACPMPVLNGKWLEDLQVGQSLRGIRCPVLLLRGDPLFGGMMPAGETDLLYGPVSDLTRLDMTGVGHQIHGAATEAMARALWAFLPTVG
jgi:pimeloyl-ACP methyl ester carboxylesterase